MSKSKFMQTVLIIGSVLIIIGIALMLWSFLTYDGRRVIVVKLEDGQTEPLSFEALALVPGEECEFLVKLKEADISRYNLELSFVDLGEEMTLKNFARVRISVGDEVVCDTLLAEAFENEKMVLPVDFGKKKNTELKIVYYLPIEIGNEAKNAEAYFELLLTASNE